MTRSWRCEKSIPVETTTPSRSQRIKRAFFSTNDQSESEKPVLISGLIRCIQKASTTSVIAVDRVPLLYFTIRKVAKRVTLCVMLELDKKFHVEKLSHHRDRIGVSTEVCRIVFGEEDIIRFERRLGVKSIPSKPCHVVSHT